MQPDDNSPIRADTSQVPERSLDQASSVRPSSQNAAADLVRSRIDAIYGEKTVASSHEDETTQTPTNLAHPNQPLNTPNPYERTHTRTVHPQAEQWQQYHSAWQNYYQKYYEHYYVNQVQEVAKRLQAQQSQVASQPAQTTASPQAAGIFSANTANAQKPVSRQEALHDLRARLLKKVSSSAKKARSSRHFVPIAAALCVVVVFVFLQYNRILIGTVRAYVSPGSINPQNIIVDPSTTVAVSLEPKLIIPKINVDVPVVYGVGYDHASQMKAMEAGVAHFAIPGANSVPGQMGNTVLSGHSSNDLLDPGNYKFIFAQLDRLTTGDMIYANYEGTRYSYTVTKMEVVMPTEVSKLIYPTDKPVLTLITCTPIGTAEKRLLVTAEQVSPNPAEATAAPDSTASGSQSVAIPGESPTLVERLFRR